MNLYKSLLLSAVMVTSFGAAFAGEDNQAPQAGHVAAVTNFLKTNKDKVAAFCAKQGTAVKAECQVLLTNVKEGNLREVVANKAVITGAAVATLVAAGVGIYAYFFKKAQGPVEPVNQQPEVPANVEEAAK